jgi:excisionase family DNA binding protein
MEKAALTVAEAAELLGVSQDLVYDACQAGDLPAVRLGKRILIPCRALDQWLGYQRGRRTREATPA